MREFLFQTQEARKHFLSWGVMDIQWQRPYMTQHNVIK